MKKSNSTIGRTLRVALLASTVGLGAMTLSAPAFAQDDGATTSKDEGQAIVITGSRIVRRDFDANSPTVTVDQTMLQQSSTAAIEQQLNKLPQFVASQSSTVKNNEGGLVPAGGDIQPNSTNTPGAATISLRGVGANRTLVLIDGRRGTPGNASGTVDISTIPSSAIERVEIVSGGASATYGADAVAGVTNFILKKNFKGFQLDGQMGISQYGDGFEYQLSGIMGTDFADGRGNISLALSTNERNPSYENNRPWYRDQWANPNIGGNAFFIARPGMAITPVVPGTFAAAFPGANPPVPEPGAFSSTTIYTNSDGSLWTGDGFGTRGGASNFKPWGALDQFNQYKLTAAGTIADNITNNYLTVPLTRYNAYARGNYEINDWVGVFGQAMFSHTSTYTRQAPGNITSGWDANIPWGTGVYLGNSATPASVLRNGDSTAFGPYADPTPGNLADNPTNPAFAARYGGANPILTCANNPVGGCTNTQAFEQVVPAAMQTLLNNRVFDFTNTAGANGPAQLRAEFPDPRETFTDVMTYNLVAGLEGTIPGTDWTWDVSLNHGVSMTTSRQTGIYSLERTRAIVSSPNFGEGFSYTGNQGSTQPGFGASTGKCTTGFDFFNVQGNATNVSQDCRQAIRADLNNKGTMQQTIVEANLQGKLLDLPAGELRSAVGVSYRKQSYTFINDGLLEKDRSFLDQAIGIYPSGDTIGSISTKEIYGELLVPVIHNTPFIQEFNLELGGRISDYDTTGTSYTFKILGDWKVNDWLRLRGGFNRAERAPNIAELFLSPQQSFGFDTVGDLCSTRLSNPASANPASNKGGATGAADVRAVCEQLMKRDNNGVAPADTNGDGHPDYAFYGPIFGAFQPTGPGFSFASVAGNTMYRNTIDPNIPALKPEKANTWTIGAVIRSPLKAGPLSRLQLSVDYFNITINDPIGALSVGAAEQLCVDPTYNPLVNGAAASDAAAAAAITSPACGFVKRSPDQNGGGINSAAMVTTYRNDGQVKLSGIDANLSWSSPVGPGTLFANAQYSYMFDFKAKELDPNPLYDYVGTQGTGIKGLNFGSSFTWKLFATVGYGLGGANVSLQWQHTPPVDNSIFPDQTTGVGAYDLFNLNASYQINRDVGVRFGVDNLFNKRPLVSGVNVAADPKGNGTLPGGSYSFFTDTQGRRFSLGVNAKF